MIIIGLCYFTRRISIWKNYEKLKTTFFCLSQHTFRINTMKFNNNKRNKRKEEHNSLARCHQYIIQINSRMKLICPLGENICKGCMLRVKTRVHRTRGQFDQQNIYLPITIPHTFLDLCLLLFREQFE